MMQRLIFLSLFLVVATSSYTQDWQKLGLYDDYDPGLYGFYSTLNEYSPQNCPGFKEKYVQWTTDESVFIYESIGFYEIISGEHEKVRVMLWEFSQELMQWRCVQDRKGTDLDRGQKGVAHINNFPGIRERSPTWTDHENNLWLFSGHYFFQGNLGPDYIDLWKFDTKTQLWTYVNGVLSDDGFSGNYEQRGVPSSTAVPNRRPFGGSASPPPTPLTFTDNNGDLVLYRGSGSNDLWRYNIASNQWVWLFGEDPKDGIDRYNYTSPRHTSHDNGLLWTDEENNYLFLDDFGTTGRWMIWKFDTDALVWTEEKKYNNFSDEFEKIFRKETGDDTSFRSANSPAYWKQDFDYLWFFGATSNGFPTNMMYRLNLKTYQWSWYNGVAPTGVTYPNRITGFAYKRGEARPTNLPRVRSNPLTWSRNGKLYLGYGQGYEATGFLHDVWSYDLSDYNFTYELGRTHNPKENFRFYGDHEYSMSDTIIYKPETFCKSYNVGTVYREGYIYRFDADKDFYRFDDDNGIHELLREKQPVSVGQVGEASQEVYPNYFSILGIIDNEIYGFNGVFGKRIYKYNIETNLFTCVFDKDVYSDGPIGEFNDQNVPQMSDHYASWIDKEGIINLFTGEKVWLFDPAVNQWAFMNEYKPDYSLVPRDYNYDTRFNWWIDDADDLWIFNYSMSKYDKSENSWDIVKHGMSEIDASHYGEQKRFSLFNNPPARSRFINWTDDQGRFWMANGRSAERHDNRVFHDIWMFEPRSEDWVWLDGFEGIVLPTDTFFRRYDIEEPLTNGFEHHNTYSYSQGTQLTVVENCEGTVWKIDYKDLIPDYNLIFGKVRFTNSEEECNRRDLRVPDVQ